MEGQWFEKMADVMVDQGMPRKVLHLARQLGVHNDCIISGNLCAECHKNVMEAFEFFYGDAKTEEEVILRILEDFRKDIEDDLYGD